MSGILFSRTKMLSQLHSFYINEIGCELWLEQIDCIVLKHGNLLFGFCQRDDADRQGLITFFYDSKEEVDRLYDRLKAAADSEPKVNDKYDIYHFFARDPEGRAIEFQYFNHPVNRYLDGEELLLTRRSIRRFTESQIPDGILNKVLDISRYAPTSRNTQSYYFKIIREKDLLEWLSGLRGSSSAPIGRAPLAVAICSDPAISKRYIQDGCIAAYHLLLAAWTHGLGTCWIAAMDRDDVKEMLNVPKDHYIATITPLGYPAKLPTGAPERKDLSWFVRE